MDSKEYPKVNHKQCFKWSLIVVLHFEDIKHNFERINLLKYCEDQYNWNRIEFPLVIQKTGKFEKNNLVSQ